MFIPVSLPPRGRLHLAWCGPRSLIEPPGRLREGADHLFQAARWSHSFFHPATTPHEPGSNRLFTRIDGNYPSDMPLAECLRLHLSALGHADEPHRVLVVCSSTADVRAAARVGAHAVLAPAQHEHLPRLPADMPIALTAAEIGEWAAQLTTMAPLRSLAPLPDGRYVGTDEWMFLWHRHAHIITPLRQRGLVCDVDSGLSATIIRASLPDGSALVISPPQEPPEDRPTGHPSGWLVTRVDPETGHLQDVLYNSEPARHGLPAGEDAQHGPEVAPMLAAIDVRLTESGLLPAQLPARPVTAPAPVTPAAPQLPRPRSR